MADPPPSSDGSRREQKHSSSSNLPEGMRVVRKHRKRKKDAARQTLFVQKSDILRDMETPEAGVVGVKAQIERVRNAKKAGGQERPLEEDWGQENRRRGIKWVALAVLALLIPVVAIIMGFALLGGERGDPARELESTLNFNVEEGVPLRVTGPLSWFQENSTTAFSESVEIMESFNKLEDPAQGSQLFRRGARSVERINQEGRGWPSEFYVDDPRRLTWEYGTQDDIGFMAIEGRLKNYLPFRTYFVKTEEGILLDWEASTGWSEIPLNEIKARAPALPAQLRCWIIKEPNFDSSDGPASLRSWYLILSPDEEEEVWAAVPNGGEVDLAIKDALNYSRMILPRLNKIRAVVQLRKERGAGRARFVVDEFVTEDWVLP